MPFAGNSAKRRPVPQQVPGVRVNRVADPAQQRMADTLKRDVGPTIGKDILQGLHVDGSLMGPLPPATSAVNTTIIHGLGRVPIGWIVERCTGAMPWFYEVTADDSTITFASLTACTVRLWVY